MAATALGLAGLLPAAAPAQEREDFVFPSLGDPRLGQAAPRLVEAGDGVTGVREIELPHCSVLTGRVVVSPNELQQGCAPVLVLRVGEREVGWVRAWPGAETLAASFPLDPPVPGPELRLELALTEDIGQGCGHLVLPDDVTVWSCLYAEQPPCDAGGPYACDEGGGVRLDADPGDPAGSLAWDLDADGLYEDGHVADPEVDCAQLDGPDERDLSLRVRGTWGTVTCGTTLSVANLPPEVASPGGIPPVGLTGLPYELCLEVSDPSPLDAVVCALAEGPDGAWVDEARCLRWVPTREQAGAHDLTVRCTDDDGGAGERVLSVRVLDSVGRPVVSAGEDRTVEPCAFELCCEGEDPDGQPLSYAWAQVDGPGDVAFDDLAAACTRGVATAPGTYTLACSADDGERSSLPDMVEVTVEDVPPTCHAGPDAVCVTDRPCILDGRRSADANGDLVQVLWSVSGDEPVRIADVDGPITSFVPGAPGVVCFELACRDESTDGEPDRVCVAVHRPEGDAAEHAPIAVCPTAPRRVLPGETVVLDGSRSFDPDGELPLGHLWRQAAGPEEVVVEDPDRPRARFAPPRAGVYRFELSVLGRVGLDEQWSLPCELTVQAAEAGNEPPRADAGPGQVVAPGALVYLDGMGSRDLDLDPLAFHWRQVEGPPVRLEDPRTAGPSFSACAPGLLRFELVVDDDFGDSLPASTWVSVQGSCNGAPQVHAGSDQRVAGSETVRLSASGQAEPGEGPLRLAWAQAAGPAVRLRGRFSGEASLLPRVWGLYRFSLLAVDAWGSDEEPAPGCWRPAWSLPEEVRVAVDGERNRLPVADAGPDVDWSLGGGRLDGCGSRDPDGDALTWRWTQTGGPPARVDAPSGCDPLFEVGEAGAYRFCLTVDDGYEASLPDCVEHRVGLGLPPAPPRPVLLEPADGAVVRTEVVELAFGARDAPAGEPPVWELELDLDAGFGGPAWVRHEGVLPVDGEPARLEVAGLAEDARHSWRVRLGAGEGRSDWAVRAFSLDVHPTRPGRPWLVSPAEGAVVGSRTPELVVGAAVDPDPLDPLAYRFEVTPDRRFSRDVVRSGDVPGDEAGATWTPPLPHGGVWFWRARAVDSTGLVGRWSLASWFEAPDDPPPPDGGTPDRPADASAAGPGPGGTDGVSGGCGCRTSGGGRTGPWVWVAALFRRGRQ